MPTETILLLVILASGLYMAWNIGANDVANAMGTSVGSGALTLRKAVMIAAVLEFSGAFFFGSHVSKTIQEGIVNSSTFSHEPLILVLGMLAALIGAGAWLQIASYNGLPVSTTHSIVGAIIGFGLVIGGTDAIYWENVAFIGSSWILSPLLGGALSYAIFSFLRKQIFYSARPFQATKRLLPFFIFFTTAGLFLTLLSKNFLSLGLEFPLWAVILLSICIGSAAAIWVYSLLRKKGIKHGYVTPKNTNKAILADLATARKHLTAAQASTSGDVGYHLGIVLEEVEGIVHNIEAGPNREQLHEEYEAVEKIFAYLQIISACLMAFAHGANDVANAIGPLSAAVTILLSGAIHTSGGVPLWALALGGLGIVLGLATWGWRVIETIGKKLTELTPSRGFSAEFGAAITILAASRLGLPISATHTLVGSVLGVGLAKGIGALNLATMRDILISWIVTIPIGAIMAIFFFYGLRFLFT